MGVTDAFDNCNVDSTFDSKKLEISQAAANLTCVLKLSVLHRLTQ